MDPISLIIAALAAGASAGLKDTAGDAVKDGYSALKALVLRRFKDDRDAEAQVEAVERDPEADHAALGQRLASAGAGADEELVRKARDLLETIDPAGARIGKYNVQVTGGKGVVVGDHATVTQTFND
jgi:hypothetical protein